LNRGEKRNIKNGESNEKWGKETVRINLLVQAGACISFKWGKGGVTTFQGAWAGIWVNFFRKRGKLNKNSNETLKELGGARSRKEKESKTKRTQIKGRHRIRSTQKRGEGKMLDEEESQKPGEKCRTLINGTKEKSRRKGHIKNGGNER